MTKTKQSQRQLMPIDWSLVQFCVYRTECNSDLIRFFINEENILCVFHRLLLCVIKWRKKVFTLATVDMYRRERLVPIKSENHFANLWHATNRRHSKRGAITSEANWILSFDWQHLSIDIVSLVTFRWFWTTVTAWTATLFHEHFSFSIYPALQYRCISIIIDNWQVTVTTTTLLLTYLTKSQRVIISQILPKQYNIAPRY